MDTSQWLDKLIAFGQTDWGLYTGLIIIFIMIGYLAMKN